MKKEVDPRFQDGREWVYKIPETADNTRIGANLGHSVLSLPDFGESVDPRAAARERYQRTSRSQDHGTRGNSGWRGEVEVSPDLRPRRVKVADATTQEDIEVIDDPHVDLSELLDRGADLATPHLPEGDFTDHAESEVVYSSEAGGYQAHRQHILAEGDPDYNPDDLDDPSNPNYDPYGAWEAAGPGNVFEADSVMGARKREISRKNPDYRTDPEEDFSDYLDGFHITNRP